MRRAAWHRATNCVLPEAPPDGSFAERVVRWQASHGRSHLPWQNTLDPYRVWLSEVMLQQTQVVTVLGYFERFLARFPDVAALASGSEDEVLGLWSGLGYYSRARNMHRCAQAVVERFGGAFPPNAAQLATLPGIGRSTAAAIAAFCFGERVAILDGNVKRVLTRLLAFDADLSSAANERALWGHATDLLPPADRPDDIRRYTQGVMDLGATLCLPRRPSCMLCPVAELCVARSQGRPEAFPVKTRRTLRTAQSLWVLNAIDPSGRRWLARRPATGIWARLHALPMFEGRADLLATLPPSLHGAVCELPAFAHVLTHRELHLHVVEARLSSGTSPFGAGEWMEPERWRSLGLPTPIRRLLERDAAG